MLPWAPDIDVLLFSMVFSTGMAYRDVWWAQHFVYRRPHRPAPVTLDGLGGLPPHARRAGLPLHMIPRSPARARDAPSSAGVH
jgi:hypothetical protein